MAVRVRKFEVPALRPEDPRLAVRLLLPLVLTLLSAALYFKTLHHPLIFDDPAITHRQADVIERSGIVTLWGHDYLYGGLTGSPDLYRPVTVLSFWLDRRLDGAGPNDPVAPWRFRVTNIVLLAALGCLVAMWVGRYTGRTASWLAAAIFVAHPIHTELINHVVGRADILAMIGILGFLYTQRRALEVGHWQWWRVLVAALSAFLAVGAKETGILLVPLAVAQAWPHRRAADAEPSHNLVRTHAITLLAAAVPLTLYLVGRFTALRHEAITGPDEAIAPLDPGVVPAVPLASAAWSQRLAAGLDLAHFYLRQAIFPDTSFDHTPSPLPAPGDLRVWLGVMALGVMLAVLVVAVRRRNWLMLPLLLALGQLAMVGNVLFPTGVYAANRLALPFALLLSCFIAETIHRLILGSTRRRALAVLPAAAYVLGLGVLVWQANVVWSSELSRTRADVAAHPYRAEAHVALSKALIRDGFDNVPEAAASLRRALELDGSLPGARARLAELYERIGEPEKAAEQYGQLVRHSPRDWRAHLRLGYIHLARADLESAERCIDTAARVAPAAPEVLLQQADLARARGRFEDAIGYYERVLRVDPANPSASRAIDELRHAVNPR